MDMEQVDSEADNLTAVADNKVACSYPAAY